MSINTKRKKIKKKRGLLKCLYSNKKSLAADIRELMAYTHFKLVILWEYSIWARKYQEWEDYCERS